VRFRIDEALLVASLEPAAGPPLPTASPEPEAAAVTPPPPEGALDAAPTPTAPPVAGGDPEPEHTGQQSNHQSSQQQQNRGLAAGTDDGYGRYYCPGCKPVTPKQVDSIVKEAVSVYGLSAASAARLAQMADAPPVPTPLPEDWLAALESLQGVAFVNRRLFLQAVETRLNIVVPTNVDAEQMTPIIAAAARKQEPSPYPPVTITSEGCGCLRNFSDTIYGFLPPWIGADDATGAAAAEHAAASAPTLPVDFSVLSRIGYFGLTLQADGKPAPDRHWQPSFDLGGFIATAHRHRTQVDLVVRAAGWRTWTDSVVQDRAVDQIVSHVTRTIKPAAMPAISWQALFNRFHSTRLDGVSLFFEHYDATAEQSKIIDSVVTKLRAKLDAENRPYFVNLVLDVELSPAAESEQIESILSVARRPAVDAAKKVDLILLFLEQPSSEAKKRLRSLLDKSNAFHGQERKDLLRRIVPVISPDGHLQPQDEQIRSAGSFRQFDDDLIYFEDNFGGVGFWPLPKRTSGDYERLRGQLMQRFATDANFLQLSNIGLATQVCDFACPNRWLFRLAIDAVGGLLLLTALGASLSCRFRTILGRYGPVILALAIVLGCLVLITILCDPFWQKHRDSVGLGLILLLAVFLISRYVLALKRKRLP
jgi:hypothetical protein